MARFLQQRPPKVNVARGLRVARPAREKVTRLSCRCCADTPSVAAPQQLATVRRKRVNDVSIASSIWKRRAALALGLALANAACSKPVPEPDKARAREEKRTPSPPRSEPPARRVVAAAAREPAASAPALIPVEEDFRRDAQQKITKKSDLRAELRRIERELSAPIE
jgi:hypothetical protein